MTEPSQKPTDRIGTGVLMVLTALVVAHQVWSFMPLTPNLMGVFFPTVTAALGAWSCWRAMVGLVGPQRQAALLVGLSLFAFFLGHITQNFATAHDGIAAWLANAFFVLGAPLLVAALLTLARQALRSSVVWRLGLDALILAAALGVFAWYFLIAGALEDTQRRDLSLTVSLIYPVFDFALFGLLVLIAIRWRGPGFDREASLYTVAVLCMAVGDIGLATRNLTGASLMSAPSDVGWSWAALLLSIAAQLAHPSRRWLGVTTQKVWRPVRLPVSLQRPNVALAGVIDLYGPVAVAVLPFGLLVFTRRPSSLALEGVQIGTAVLAVLVVLRQMLTLVDNQRLNRELTRLSADLEQRVFDRTHELLDSRLQLEHSEQLERDRGAVLEMIARDEPLDRVQARLLEVADQRGRDGLDARTLRQMSDQLITVALGRRRLNEQLAHQASFDALTGLPNRALLGRQLEAALRHAEQRGFMVAVLFIDLNRFKQINDSLGHPVGDRLLQLVAKRYQSCIGPSDALARMGGDEFVVVRSGVKTLEEATQLAQKLVDSLTPAFKVDELELFVSASIGVSLYPQDGTDAATLQKNADAAMYRAKSQGAGTIRRFSKGMSAVAREKLEIENELRRALERVSDHPMDARGELELFYQPQVDLRSDRLVGFEALARWNHPTLGAISPMRFVPIAEESGLVVPLGHWVLREACRQNAAWQRAGLRPVRVAVNVSTLQFDRPEMIQTVVDALRDASLEPQYLELELLESLLVQRIDESARRMEQLRQLGVELAIDDFGTGYSSLRYLHRFPIDTLKIDRSFTQNISSSDSAYQGTRSTLPLVQAIIALAHGLGLGVIAEGVESERQADVLTQAGCHIVQGHLFSRAINALNAEQMLRAERLPRLNLRDRAMQNQKMPVQDAQPAD
jgi:diguanylate cyclase (GGDEF)-like protein